MTGVDWETAYKRCSSQNDSLPDIHDVQNYDRKKLLTIWSSLKGQFTPWIAYRGCFKNSICNISTTEHLAQQSCHYIDNNTAGNCYFECQSKNLTNGGCANNPHFQCMQSKQHNSTSAKVFKNTRNKNLVETNQNQDVNYANTTFENDNQGSNLQIDNIYVEQEEEYDHLHTSRQKKVAMQADDDKYGTASYLEEDSYSTLRQNMNDEPDLDNGYSVNNMPYSKNQSGSVNSPKYDYCYQSNQRKDWLQ